MSQGTKVEIPLWDGTEHCSGSGVDFHDYKAPSKFKTRENILWLKQFCDGCPRLMECATYAIKHEEYGFWGGMTEEQRKQFRKAHKIKLVRPEMLEDLLPDFRKHEGGF